MVEITIRVEDWDQSGEIQMALKVAEEEGTITFPFEMRIRDPEDDQCEQYTNTNWR